MAASTNRDTNSFCVPVGKSTIGTLAAALLTACIALPARGERKEAPPAQIADVGVVEHREEQIPLDLDFVDHQGRPVKLGEYFDGDRPVLLTLNYSDCPMLCSLQLDGLFDSLKKMKWDLGEQYRLVTVSIDPSEPPERAAMTRQKYLKMYGRPGSGDGYAILTGENDSIKALADAVGFHYRYVPETGEYAHTAAVMIGTPSGCLSRYLYGVQYDQQTVRLSLLEAAQGKIGTPMDQLFLYCFQYDAESGRYGAAAFTLMKGGALLTVCFIGGILLVYWRRESAKPESKEEVSVS